MADQSFPITPPHELMQQWKRTAPHSANEHEHYHYITLCAAQWGADQELKACCDHMRDFQWGFVERPDGTKIHRAIYLEQSRRPNPPSLKEQALAKLPEHPESMASYLSLSPGSVATIRHALEALND